MSNCLTEDLKKDGHQPCKYIDHIQGTNQNEWKCPLCKEIYVSVDPAYCEDCLESIIFIKERIETYKKKKIALELMIDGTVEDIEILENIIGNRY